MYIATPLLADPVPARYAVYQIDAMLFDTPDALTVHIIDADRLAGLGPVRR